MKSNKKRRSDKAFWAALWAEFFREYGDHCVDCGENDPAALTVGHLNGDGKAQRDESPYKRVAGGPFLLHLRRIGWPKNRGIATQCANCQLRDMRHPRIRPTPPIDQTEPLLPPQFWLQFPP